MQILMPREQLVVRHVIQKWLEVAIPRINENAGFSLREMKEAGFEAEGLLKAVAYTAPDTVITADD